MNKNKTTQRQSIEQIVTECNTTNNSLSFLSYEETQQIEGGNVMRELGAAAHRAFCGCGPDYPNPTAWDLCTA